MNAMSRNEQYEPPTGSTRARWIIGGVVGLILAGIAAAFLFTGSKPAPRKAAPTTVNISLPPLPPPPPPPPPPPKQDQPEPEPKQDEMIAAEPTPSVEPEPAPAPADEPAPLGTNIAGDGPDNGFGLARGGSGTGGTGTGKGGSKGGGGNRWGRYNGQVITTVADALRRNSRTRSASINVKVAIWADGTGRVTRAKLASSTGDASLDNTITNEVLAGLHLAEAPPEGMPMPIHLRLNARKAK